MTTTPPNASPRAFVAGATGYVGRHVVQALRARGFEVHAHVRPDSTALARWRTIFDQAGATTDTTPWTADAMRATLARVAPSHVFALLGTTRRRMRESATTGHGESYQSVDYGLTHLLLEATREAAPAARFIYLSAVGVAPGVRNPYLAARARIEAELAASTLSHLIAQPAYITGDDRDEARPVERLLATTLDAVMGLLDRIGLDALAGRYRTLTGPEVASGLVQLATVPTVTPIIVDARTLRIAAGGAVTLYR